MFTKLTTNPPLDNPNVNIADLDNALYAITDAGFAYKFDPETLETGSFTRMGDSVLSTAHLHYGKLATASGSLSLGCKPKAKLKPVSNVSLKNACNVKHKLKNRLRTDQCCFIDLYSPYNAKICFLSESTSVNAPNV